LEGGENTKVRRIPGKKREVTTRKTKPVAAGGGEGILGFEGGVSFP